MGLTLNGDGAFDVKQGVLRAQQLVNARTEDRPMILCDGKVAAEIQQGHLLDLFADPFGFNEPKSVITLARRGVPSLCAANKHTPTIAEMRRFVKGYSYDYGTTI